MKEIKLKIDDEIYAKLVEKGENIEEYIGKLIDDNLAEDILRVLEYVEKYLADKKGAKIKIFKWALSLAKKLL